MQQLARPSPVWQEVYAQLLQHTQWQVCPRKQEHCSHVPLSVCCRALDPGSSKTRWHLQPRCWRPSWQSPSPQSGWLACLAGDGEASSVAAVSVLPFIN